MIYLLEEWESDINPERICTYFKDALLYLKEISISSAGDKVQVRI